VIELGDPGLLHALLRCRANADVTNDDGHSPIHYARLMAVSHDDDDEGENNASMTISRRANKSSDYGIIIGQLLMYRRNGPVSVARLAADGEFYAVLNLLRRGVLGVAELTEKTYDGVCAVEYLRRRNAVGVLAETYYRLVSHRENT
jgi:hypothetical protein